MNTYETLAELQPLVGQPLGTSDWVAVDQDRIILFADATGDHQWIHVDPERAAKGPFGGAIAHGYLTLSLLPIFFLTASRSRQPGCQLRLEQGAPPRRRCRWTPPAHFRWSGRPSTTARR
jgi:acyl dehydratase